jgi:hypothetical protein
MPAKAAIQKVLDSRFRGNDTLVEISQRSRKERVEEA